jgi:hypothetical protein
MRIPLLVRGRGIHASSADRLLRFRKVLKSAQRTTFYRHSLSHAGLDTSQSLRDLHSVEETLLRLPVREPGNLPAQRRTCRVPASNLHNPLPGRPAITFATRLNGERPEVLAGSFSALIALAGTVQVERALIVITGVREGVLTSDNRDSLWSGFGVPLFEQHLGLDGQLIAHECEAHEGLHLVEQNAVWEEHAHGDLLLTSLTDLDHPTLRLRTGFSGQIHTRECECGSTQPRVLDLRLRDPSLRG